MECPICKKPVDVAEQSRAGSSFPFCSDRCRLIDLGRWLSDKYQINTPLEQADGAESSPIKRSADETN